MTQTPQPSDRQLVVYENNTANDDHGRLIAIPPDLAKGIGLPAFTVGNPVPTVGTTSGEGFYDRATGMAYVWDGTTWQSVTPRAEIREWETTKAYLQKDFVVHNDVLWTCIAPAGSPIGEEPKIPSTVWNVVGSNSKFQSWDATVNYAPADHVYIDNGLYEALTSSLNKAPVWPTDTAEWKYVGNINKYSGTQDQNAGSVPTYDGTSGFQLKQPEGIQAGSIIEKGKTQAIVNLSRPPSKFFKISANLRTIDGGANFRAPLFIGQNNNVWINLATDGSFNQLQAMNDEANLRVGYFTHAEVLANSSQTVAGGALLPKFQNYQFKEDKQFMVTFEGHRCESATDAWWIIQWHVYGPFWGNISGIAHGGYWGKAAKWDNLTSLGLKVNAYTADFFVAVEYS